MKMLEYDEIERLQDYKNFADKSWEVIKDLEPMLRFRYPRPFMDINLDVSSLVIQLPRVLTVMGGNLDGKKILDLGCGSSDVLFQRSPLTEYGDSGRMYEPWLCRTLLELNAKPVGVDALDNRGERFEFHNLDLLEDNSLKYFSDNSMDLVNAKSLFDSPLLRMLVRAGGNKKDLKQILLPQIERILKPEGYFIYTY